MSTSKITHASLHQEGQELARLIGHMWIGIDAATEYWNECTEYQTDADGTERVIITAQGGETFTVTNAQFVDAITAWVNAEGKGHEYGFFARFAQCWLEQDFYRADYDHDLLDHVVQHALYGRQKFA